MEYVSPFSRSWKRVESWRHRRHRYWSATPSQVKKPHTSVHAESRLKSTPELSTIARERKKPQVEVRYELTEFVRMFRTHSGNNSIGESRRPLRLSLIDELSNPRPALALARSLRRVLCEALQKTDSSRLEVLYDVRVRGRVGVGWWVRDIYAGEWDGAIDGWRWISQAHAGDAGEGEEVGLVRVDAGTDEAGDAGGDTPFVDGGAPLILDNRYGGEDGVAWGGFDETYEGVCDVPG
jgi:hypothetical protein